MSEQEKFLQQDEIEKMAECLEHTGWANTGFNRRYLCKIVDYPERELDINLLDSANRTTFTQLFIGHLNDNECIESILKIYFLVKIINPQEINPQEINFIIERLKTFKEYTDTEIKNIHNSVLKKLQDAREKSKVRLRSISLASIITLTVVMIFRFGGAILPLEFLFYDNFMKFKSQYEPIDKNILIIEIDKLDKGTDGALIPISYDKVLDILKILEKLRPKVIDLNLNLSVIKDDNNDKNDNEDKNTRDRNNRDYKKLVDYLKEQNNIVVHCSLSNEIHKEDGFAPPDGSKNIGVSNFITDGESDDDLVRKQVLRTGMPLEQEPCQSKVNSSYQVVKSYLRTQKDIKIEDDEINKPIKITKGLHQTIFLPLDRFNKGAYEGGNTWGINTGNEKGEQILINYGADNFNTIKVSQLEELKKKDSKELETKYGNNLIILIGYGIETGKDRALPFRTPIDSEMSSTILIAHMVSQMSRAVVDKRPLLQPFALYAEIFWIFTLSILPCVWLVRPIRVEQFSFLIISIKGSIIVIASVGVCYILFSVVGLWFPIAPFLLVVLLTPYIARQIENKIPKQEKA